MKKELYMVTSKNCLFFVYTDLPVEEIEKAYLTELNSKYTPRESCKVSAATLNQVNHIRYKGQPVYALQKNDGASLYCGLYIESVIRRGYHTITEEDLY